MFDVDWEDGAPPKKLALNRGDNPYAVADRFLEQEGLPASYRQGGAGWLAVCMLGVLCG